MYIFWGRGLVLKNVSDFLFDGFRFVDEEKKVEICGIATAIDAIDTDTIDSIVDSYLIVF